MKRYAWWLALILLACSGEPPARLNSGDAAPAFTARLIDGATLDFPAARAGEPLVLRFWADWCRFCAPEMKMIDAVRARHAGRFAILAVNVGQEAATVAAFMARLGVSYPAALDEDARIAKRYGVVALPTTFFIDAQGIVRGKIVGEADEALFERHIQALLQ
ncbi:MAG: TlpA family protein disulfide reductase [Rhodocyclaceae bacterium]|nr:TlpA family protein disulfide reductase [Rhodocyclaceae bacterium]